MEKAIVATLRYFEFFDYPATFEEIYLFLTKKTNKKRLKATLDNLLLQRKLKYTLGEYSISSNKNLKSLRQKLLLRRAISKNKLNKIQFYIKILSLFFQIKLIGLSGSMAMMNAQENDDIDLFIITAYKKLWTGRLVALILVQILGLRRSFGQKSIKDKVCLNLFFDESNLCVPKQKRNLYVAHEILQMKPLVDKDNIYQRFLWKNNWIYDIFPNQNKVKKQFESKKRTSVLDAWGEFICKQLQLFFINKHKTKEIITDGQLWFFPEDFEKKLIDII